MKDEWISVSDKKPEIGKNVLIYATSYGKSGGIGIGIYWGMEAGLSPETKGWTNIGVTHWQELPPTPIQP